MAKKEIEFSKDPVFAQIKSHISSMLGSGTVNIEMSDEDYVTVVKESLRKLAPYYEGKRYVQATGNNFDLSAHNPMVITNVYNTKSASVLNATDLVYGSANMIIYDSSFKERLITYLSYKQLLNEFTAIRPQTWRYIAPYLIIDNFNGEVLIEMQVNPVIPSDVEKESQYYPWIFDYSLALAKQIVGRKRSKFKVDSAPFVLDGETLIAEGIREQEELESQLIGPIYIL